MQLVELDSTSSTQQSEEMALTKKSDRQRTKAILNRLMFLFVMNLLDIVFLAFFMTYNIIVRPGSYLLGGDVVYGLSLVLLIFAIKWKNRKCLNVAAICQICAIVLKFAGIYNQEQKDSEAITFISLSVFVAFTVVPSQISRYWYKVDTQDWLMKFDKETKVYSYKIESGSIDHS